MGRYEDSEVIQPYCHVSQSEEYPENLDEEVQLRSLIHEKIKELKITID